jgi:hypothetical protein
MWLLLDRAAMFCYNEQNKKRYKSVELGSND